jgi:hypothetical protein
VSIVPPSNGCADEREVRARPPDGFAVHISCAVERQGPVAQPVFKTGTPS